jgi:hypothetical protein
VVNRYTLPNDEEARTLLIKFQQYKDNRNWRHLTGIRKRLLSLGYNVREYEEVLKIMSEPKPSGGFKALELLDMSKQLGEGDIDLAMLYAQQSAAESLLRIARTLPDLISVLEESTQKLTAEIKKASRS